LIGVNDFVAPFSEPEDLLLGPVQEYVESSVASYVSPTIRVPT
jgi:hypothetical protein